MSTRNQSAPARRKARDSGPIEVGDVVQVQRVDADDQLGVVREVDDVTPVRIVVETKADGPWLNTDRGRCDPITGARADTVRQILGGDGS